MSYSVSKTAITVYWINLQSNCQYLGEKNTNCLILSINREVFFWWTSWVTPSFFSLNFHGVSRNSFGRNGIPILSFLPLLRPLLPLSPPHSPPAPHHSPPSPPTPTSSPSPPHTPPSASTPPPSPPTPTSSPSPPHTPSSPPHTPSSPPPSASTRPPSPPTPTSSPSPPSPPLLLPLLLLQPLHYDPDYSVPSLTPSGSREEEQGREEGSF